MRQNLDRRPMLASHADNPLPRIRHLLEVRTPVYRAIKDYEFDTSNWDTSEQVADCILSIVSGQNNEPCLPPHTTAPPSPPAKKKPFSLNFHRE